MTDGLDQALVKAGVDLLRADANLTVYPGGVPSPTPAPPYVVVYYTVEWPTGAPGDALDGISGSPTVRWYCHCVGGGLGATLEAAAIAAVAVRQRVRTQLLNKRPTVAGIDTAMIREEPGSPPPQRDESVGFPVMSTLAIFTLNATT